MTNPDPVFSIIVPAYNARATIERCLRSVVEQTVADFEVIVVDDVSTDDTVPIVSSVDDPRVRLVRADQNRGPAACRNRALDIARGEFIVFVDADDWIEPTFLAEALAALRQPAAPDLAVTRYQVVSSSGRSVDRQRFSSEDALGAFLEDRIVSAVWAKIFRRAIIETHAIRFPDLRLMEDTVFNVTYLAHTDRAVLIEKPLYNYFFNLHSTTSVLSLEGLVEATDRASSAIRQVLAPLSADHARALEVRDFRMIAIQSFRHMAYRRTQSVRDFASLRATRARLWRWFGLKAFIKPGLRLREKLTFAAFLLSPRLTVDVLSRTVMRPPAGSGQRGRDSGEPPITLS